jgi:hypothetical protein
MTRGASYEPRRLWQKTDEFEGRPIFVSWAGYGLSQLGIRSLTVRKG